MIVRLHNVGKWALLEAGSVLELNGQAHRKVRVEFNTAAPTRIDMIGDDDKATFVAVVNGYEVVEFTAGEQVHLVATSDDDVFYFTNDGDDHSTALQSVSFTKIATRRARNPELERMMFKMQQNIDRRLAALDAERAAWEAAKQADAETGEVIEDGADGEPAAGSDPGTPAVPPAGAVEPAGKGAASGAAT